MTIPFKISVLVTWLLILIITIMTSNVHAQSQPQKDYYIKSVFFGGGSFYVDLEQKDELVEFILEIEDLREYEIEIHGHTDNIGSISYNQWLSEMRSFEVLDIISELEFDKTAIQVHDFGELSPYYDNKTWAGKLSNRRVDVIIRKITM